jgi:hypothetical protein
VKSDYFQQCNHWTIKIPSHKKIHQAVVYTADFWLFGSIFGCLVTTAAIPYLKFMMQCNGNIS